MREWNTEIGEKNEVDTDEGNNFDLQNNSMSLLLERAHPFCLRELAFSFIKSFQ